MDGADPATDTETLLDKVADRRPVVAYAGRLPVDMLVVHPWRQFYRPDGPLGDGIIERLVIIRLSTPPERRLLVIGKPEGREAEDTRPRAVVTVSLHYLVVVFGVGPL